MYHVTVWLLQPTCYLFGWPNGEIGPEAPFLIQQAASPCPRCLPFELALASYSSLRAAQTPLLSCYRNKSCPLTAGKQSSQVSLLPLLHTSNVHILQQATARSPGGSVQAQVTSKESSGCSTRFTLIWEKGPFLINHLLSLPTACQKPQGKQSVSLCKYTPLISESWLLL